MTRINLNKLAREVTLEEGGDIQCSIAQVKQIQRITFKRLINKHAEADILKMLERYLG